MPPPKEPEPALAAPGVGELLATPVGGISCARSHRPSADRPYSHVRLEIDLAPGPPRADGVLHLERLAELLHERKVVERGTLIMLAATTIHALASRRFRTIDHWEISPGGDLPPPRPGTGASSREPVGELLATLESGAWAPAAAARSFTASLSDLSGGRADVTVRRVHRQRRHALTIDLRGHWTPSSVKDLEHSISERLPVVRITKTKFQYA